MNSDPYDSAAWRTFGMLDADESAIFDEAMRYDPLLRGAYLEMDRLSAAIAAATSIPIPPKAGQLERLQARLRLYPSHRTQFWLALSGWSAAAALAMLLVLDHMDVARPADQAAAPVSPAPNQATEVTAAAPASAASQPAPQGVPAVGEKPVVPGTAVIASNEPESKSSAKVETKRLIQEIEVLRDNLEKYQHRDRVLFEAVPGMALPIIMTMNPPGVEPEDANTLAKNDGHSPIAAMLGDAMKVMNRINSGTFDGQIHSLADHALAGDAPPVEPVQPTEVAPPIAGSESTTETQPAPQPAPQPAAIPIYDAARDAGTLVVNNLPPAELGQVYNLWVKTANSERPIYVGSLPESSASGADSFDFSLGSTMILPSGFVLTRDPAEQPANPTEKNTVLQGPPTPGR